MFYGLYMETFLAVGCSIHEVSVCLSTMRLADAGCRVFAVRPIEVDYKIRYYYRSLMCNDLGVPPKGLKQYAKSSCM